MNNDIVISVKNVTKTFKIYLDKGSSLKEKLLFWRRNRYEKRLVLDDISFDIHKGETVGLIGKNGSGKSTTLKMLTGIYYPNKGSIDTVGRISSLIELGAGFHPDMSGRENIYTNAAIFGLTKKEIDERLDDIISFSELEKFIDNPVRTYSSGMYMRLAFSVAINVNADILLIDEILAVGDANFQQKCYAKLNDLKKQGVTIVIVTHDGSTIRSFCERAIWVNNGKIAYDGKAAEAMDRYNEFMANEALNSLLKRENRKEKNLRRESKNNHYGKYMGLITDAYMLNEKNERTWVQETGKKGKIVIEYDLSQESEYGYTFGMNFATSDGKILYGTNNKLDNCQIDVCYKEKGKIIFEIDRIPLLQGEYGVNISICDQNGTPLDYYVEYDVMKVISPSSKSVGIVNVPHKWRKE